MKLLVNQAIALLISALTTYTLYTLNVNTSMLTLICVITYILTYLLEELVQAA